MDAIGDADFDESEETEDRLSEIPSGTTANSDVIHRILSKTNTVLTAEITSMDQD